MAVSIKSPIPPKILDHALGYICGLVESVASLRPPHWSLAPLIDVEDTLTQGYGGSPRSMPVLQAESDQNRERSHGLPHAVEHIAGEAPVFPWASWVAECLLSGFYRTWLWKRLSYTMCARLYSAISLAISSGSSTKPQPLPNAQ